MDFPRIDMEVIIGAPATTVWAALTDPMQMAQWMSQTPIAIVTNWQEGHPFIVRGPWFKSHFENTGTVQICQPPTVLQYTHLSSLSRLPDTLENHTIIRFELTPMNDQTRLELRIDQFPTEAIYRHFKFYWTVTIELLRKFIEMK